MNDVTIVLGEKLFEFPSFVKWEQKANGWFSSAGVPSSDTICIDSAGRVCTCGRDFMRADKEGAYPIAVYDTVPNRIMGMPVIVDPQMPEGTLELRNLQQEGILEALSSFPVQRQLITSEEKAVLGALAQAWDKFLLLEMYHVDDKQDFRGAIHAAQNIVLARAGMRALARLETNEETK